MGKAGFEFPIELEIEKNKRDGTNKASFSGLNITKIRIRRLIEPKTRPKIHG